MLRLLTTYYTYYNKESHYNIFLYIIVTIVNRVTELSYLGV